MTTMPKINKTILRNLLDDENYMDALAYFASAVADADYKAEAENMIEKMDHKVWKCVSTLNGDSDYSGNWLRVYTALQMGTMGLPHYYEYVRSLKA